MFLTIRMLKQVRVKYIGLISLAAALMATSVGAAETSPSGDTLAAGFVNPPSSAKPHVYWQWLNGNVTKEGITADLEAMHQVGINGVLVQTVGMWTRGPMQKMDPQFFDMMEYAAREADRLGMKVSMSVTSGWAGCGGPWVKPEQSMQIVTSSEVSVSGPTTFNGNLPQPLTKRDFYRDIAVWAFPAPADEQEVVTADNPVTITTNAPGVDAASLANGMAKNQFVEFPVASIQEPYYLQAEFAKPVSVQLLRIKVQQARASGGLVQVSDDGMKFKTLRNFELKPMDLEGFVEIRMSDEPVTARFFRLEFKNSGYGLGNQISQFAFSNRSTAPGLYLKAFFDRPHNSRMEVPIWMEKARSRKVGSESIVRRDASVDLTSAMQTDGTLKWDVPPGKWTIVRFGHTSTGATAGGPWNGLEVDKVTPEGVKLGWSGMMKPTIERLGPLVGKTLIRCEFDSWEVGGQNWTPKMAEEFKQRRGYDPTPYLPAITGRIVESPDCTERFLWDLRRTVSEMIAENFFRPFTELCRSNRLESMVEPYYGPMESMYCGAQVDIPTAEFWQDSDSGVKYFSGTATYEKDVQIPAGLLRKEGVLWLDLGEVKNLAKVTVNGQDLGILWKKPFRVDIASAVKAGKNHLEIQITNQWPNRLIGDEHLPEDISYSGKFDPRTGQGIDSTKDWPQWLKEGKPSPTGRITFTTWRHFTKDSPLLPSGLLGPVMLMPYETENGVPSKSVHQKE